MRWIKFGVQNKIIKAEQQNNNRAVILDYRLLCEMIIELKQNQGKRTWRNHKDTFFFSEGLELILDGKTKLKRTFSVD